MIKGLELWAAFALLAVGTFVPRAAFIAFAEKGALPSVVQRALRYAPAAALSALVVPDLLLDHGGLHPFNPKLAAGIVVAAVALRSRSPWLPFILGMGVLIGLRKGLGW